MQEIAKTESHTLSVDLAKNRIYFTVTGKSLLESPTFVEDWESAKRLVSPGFTVLMDVSQIRHMSKEWIETSVRVQKMLIHAGLAGAAEILSEHVAEKLQIHQINRLPGSCCYAKEEVFMDRKAAEAWLDWISKKTNSP